MATIQKNIEISGYTTFGIKCIAKKFAKFNSLEMLKELMDENQNSGDSHLILGGGSNLLFTKDFNGLILKNEISGIELKSESEDHYHIELGAGQNWHEFVLHAVKNNWAGVENLSLIPGSCGAAPMQNIGAYGVEIKDLLEYVEVYHIPTGESHNFSMEECKLGYRESVFKNTLKGQYVITKIHLKLNKNPEFKTSYGAIQTELERLNITELNIEAISNAVMNIRNSKLPNPKVIGNAGSFFKNPIISKDQFEKVLENYPGIPSYPAGDKVKLAAGWLIEQAGWKGKRINDYGVHEQQALVLVNYGGAKGQDIYQLSEDIKEDVMTKFGIDLEREVNIM